MRLILLPACVALSPSLAMASPPPPPPDYIIQASTMLSSALTAQTFSDYAAEFADDVHVFSEGRLAESDKASWLAVERGRLGKIERHVVGHAEGYDNILVIDEVDDQSNMQDKPTAVIDPRFVTRAVEYRFGQDHLIHEVHFVQGGGFWIPARHGG